MASLNHQTRGHLVYITNTAAFFLSHRLQLAKSAQLAGYRVTVASPYDVESVVKIKQHGFLFAELPMSRKGINPLFEIKTLFHFYLILKKAKPDVVHAFTLKPILYTSIIRTFLSFHFVSTFTGLGYLFTSTQFKPSLVRKLVSFFLKYSLKNADKIIFQNPDDQQLFEDLGIVSKPLTSIIPGTGVDINLFVKTESSNTPVVIFPARFLKDKGIMELITACRELDKENIKFELWLIGKRDDGNPSSISLSEFEKIKQLSFVKKIEYRNDMHIVYAQAQVVCLPSYREGIPLSLIEACACGRAIIATDVPGCRSVVQNGKNGFLVPAQNSSALALAIKEILTNTKLRQNMESSSRQIAEDLFDQKHIIQKNLFLYKTN